MNPLLSAISLFRLPQEATQETSGDGTADSLGEVDADTSNMWEAVDGMIDGFFSMLPRLAIAIVVFIIFMLLARLVRRILRRTTKDRESANLGKVLGRLGQAAMMLTGLLIAVTIVAPSIKPGDLLALLGVSGVAIGFAFKDILQNFLAGLLILLREPFKVGDQIVSGSFEGTVESIETRATIIKTYDGQRVVIPNADIYTDPVVVKTAYGRIRSQYDVGVGYGDDIETARRTMLEAIQQVEGVHSDPAPDVLTWELAGSSVNIRARWWTDAERATVVQVYDRVLKAIKEALDAAYVDMPYPTQVVLFHDQTEATDGDRTQQREGWPQGDSPPAPRTISGALLKQGADAQPQGTQDSANGDNNGRSNGRPSSAPSTPSSS